MAAFLLGVLHLCQGTSASAESMESMQKQIAELKENISALKQTRGENDSYQAENQGRSYRVAQADSPPVETRTMEVPSYIPPSSSSGSMLQIYGGTTTWAHQRTNNSTISSNGNSFDDDGLDVGYTVDLFLEANLGGNHKFIVYLEGGDGNGVNNTLGTFDPATNTSSGLYSSPNYDPNNTAGSLMINSAYYEGLFFDEKLYIAIGKMDIHSLYDENDVAGDETTQFMSNMFVRSTGVSFQELNNYYAPGLKAMLIPFPWLEFSVVLANSNFDNVDEDGLAVLQVNFKPEFLHGGNYRFFCVFDDRDYARIGRMGTEGNTGWGLSFDQRFTETLAGFFRFTMLEDDLTANVVDATWALGAEVNGVLWNRPDDALGLAYGAVMVNNRVAGLPNYDDEEHFEAYYRYSVNEYIALSPNFQVIAYQPSTVYIFGLRAQFDFRL